MSQLTVLFNSVILRKTSGFVKSGDRKTVLKDLRFGNYDLRMINDKIHCGSRILYYLFRLAKRV